MKQEDDALFLQLFNAHRVVACRIISQVLRRTHPSDVEDVLQSTFIKCQRTFNPELAGSFRPWLLKSGKRNALDYIRLEGALRSRHGQTATYLQDVPDPAVQDADTFELLLRKERRDALVESIQQLAHAPWRRLCFLHFFEGLTAEQIASRLCISRGTVLSGLYRATTILTASLRKRFGLPDPTLTDLKQAA